jgi:hypothetical protein
VAVTTDILALWRQPRRTFRARLEEGPREDRAFAVLMGACGLSFIAQWPPLARAAHLDPAIPLDARMGGALMATLFLLPLIAYGVAAASHLVARALGGRGTFQGARLALFWALLGAMPGVLFYGLAAGLVGPGPAVTLTGIIVFAGFLWLWLTLLSEAEREPRAWT